MKDKHKHLAFNLLETFFILDQRILQINQGFLIPEGGKLGFIVSFSDSWSRDQHLCY